MEFPQVLTSNNDFTVNMKNFFSKNAYMYIALHYMYLASSYTMKFNALYTTSRNTDTDSRPGFYDICLLLNLPDIRILQWSEEDLARYGEEARTIGAPLEAAEHLFAELQETYYSTS